LGKALKRALNEYNVVELNQIRRSIGGFSPENNLGMRRTKLQGGNWKRRSLARFDNASILHSSIRVKSL